MAMKFQENTEETERSEFAANMSIVQLQWLMKKNQEILLL